MAFVAGAIAMGAGSVAGLGGALIQAGAARDAAQTQADAARYAADVQYNIYNQQRQDNEPWRQAGMQALGQMQDPYFQRTFGAADFQQDPGYNFRLQQGQKALEASAAARGGLMGGNFATALAKYGQDYASNEYQNAYNRFTNDQTNRFNRLASLAGLGQNANSQLGQAGMNYANGASEAVMGGANGAAAARIAQGNAWSGGLNGMNNNWMQYQWMNKMYPDKPPQKT